MALRGPIFRLPPPSQFDASANPSSILFRPGYGGNPLAEGYPGYAGYGPSPYTFSFGPYGFGSYGQDIGDAEYGMERPKPQRTFANIKAGA